MFWNDKEGYFKNDLGQNVGLVSADANLLPFYTGIIKDDIKEKRAFLKMRAAGLDRPFPLRYHALSTISGSQVATSLIMPNYQGNSIWGFLAPIFIEREVRFFPRHARGHLGVYLQLICKYKTYIEVFDTNGKHPLIGRFGHDAERGMIWASMIPSLFKKLEV